VRTAPFSALTILSVAPGIALPVASVITPEMDASPCAQMRGVARHINTHSIVRLITGVAIRPQPVTEYPGASAGRELGESVDRFLMALS